MNPNVNCEILIIWQIKKKNHQMHLKEQLERLRQHYTVRKHIITTKKLMVIGTTLMKEPHYMMLKPLICWRERRRRLRL